MTLLKHGVAAAITMAGALAFSGVAFASSAHFIDNGHYTTDTNNGLDWLDVTISVNQSYNYVSSQFGSGGEYEGWRYATGIEFNQMVSSWTGTMIVDTFYDYVTHPDGVIDPLHFLFGITKYSQLDSFLPETFDPSAWTFEGEYAANTFGIISDSLSSADNYVARLYHDTVRPSSPDFTVAHNSRQGIGVGSIQIGSYLVRDTLTPVPVPAAVWLMGSSLLGLLGYSRHRKPTTAA